MNPHRVHHDWLRWRLHQHRSGCGEGIDHFMLDPDSGRSPTAAIRQLTRRQVRVPASRHVVVEVPGRRPIREHTWKLDEFGEPTPIPLLFELDSRLPVGHVSSLAGWSNRDTHVSEHGAP